MNGNKNRIPFLGTCLLVSLLLPRLRTTPRRRDIVAHTMNINIKKRWKADVGLDFVNSLSKRGKSGNGYQVTQSPFGIIRESDLLDVTGLAFAARTEWRRISLICKTLNHA